MGYIFSSARMFWARLAYLLVVFSAVQSQKPGSLTDNAIPKMPMEVCQSEGNCQKVATGVTLDANWRWIHGKDGYENCYTGNQWDQSYCPDAATCTENCLLEGVSQSDYRNTYGITTDNSGSMTLKFVTEGQYSKNVGSRTYLVDESGENYYMFKLKNKEFTFDVDVSELPCGLNGALYFVEMEQDGGLHYPGNSAGPAYGTGYCDAQCPHDIKWINGEANCEDWSGSDNDVNAGVGHYGTCCFEFDIWGPTLRAAPTPTIPVMWRVSTGVRGWSAGTTSQTTGLTGSVTRTAVTTTTGDREIKLTSAPHQTSRWTPPGP